MADYWLRRQDSSRFGYRKRWWEISLVGREALSEYGISSTQFHSLHLTLEQHMSYYNAVVWTLGWLHIICLVYLIENLFVDGGGGLRPYPPCGTETDAGWSLVLEWLSLSDARRLLFSSLTQYKINLKVKSSPHCTPVHTGDVRRQVLLLYCERDEKRRMRNAPDTTGFKCEDRANYHWLGESCTQVCLDWNQIFGILLFEFWSHQGLRLPIICASPALLGSLSTSWLGGVCGNKVVLE